MDKVCSVIVRNTIQESIAELQTERSGYISNLK